MKIKMDICKKVNHLSFIKKIFFILNSQKHIFFNNSIVYWIKTESN
jgi:hypothetical protein